MSSLCPCGSEREFELCCAPVLAGTQAVATAEQLMRARYSAFVKEEIDFLTTSLHPEHRHDHDANATRRWAANSDWQGLEIVATEAGQEDDEQGVVEFIATFKEKGMVRKHHERSQFKKQDGVWYFVDGEVVPAATQVHNTPKVGRNDPCPCGSGKKYKKCCGR
ncbi:MAG: YchJ family protein [Chromatiales bacterium]|nr:YchJ family protein [Chromatiales bacterium]